MITLDERSSLLNVHTKQRKEQHHETICISERSCGTFHRFHIPTLCFCGLYHPCPFEHLALPRLLGREPTPAPPRQRDGRSHWQHAALHWCHRSFLLPTPGLPGHVVARHAACALARHHLSGALPGR